MDHERPQTTLRVTEHQRAYKACIPCRKRKAKCDLGGRDGPPCVRCRRELRECIFSAERSWTKKRKLDETRDNNVSITGLAARTEQQEQHSRQGSIPYSTSYGGTRLRETTNGPENSNTTAVEGDCSAHEASSMQDSTSDLTRSVMRTVVSNGNDALNLLFQAATQDQDNDLQVDPTRQIMFDPPSGNNTTTPRSVHVGANVEPAPMSPVSPELQKFWKSSKFVKMGWLSAQEIVTYIDLFFENLNPLSPALSDFYANHTNHYQLANKEPLLCSAILMISSRHHVLAGPGGGSRGYFVHERFWKFCQHLITRMLYGQEKGPVAKIRTLGSIEALLLLSEWHPRSLHFPPEADGWDSDLIVAADDEPEPASPHSPPNKWVEDVIEPAKRSDRMSWMLLGCASSLAHELNLFGQEEPGADDDNMLIRKSRARKLLYVFTTQLASRLGITSMLPQSLTHIISSRPRKGQAVKDHWDTHMLAWIELTKLFKSLSEMVFPSKAFTQQLLHSGRYVGVLEHFQPLLLQWKNNYLEDQDIPEAYRDILTIEYQYVRVYCNSIGMQAVCERALAGHATETILLERPALSFDTDDQAYIQEVIAGSCDMLEKAITLAHKDTLRFAPVRVFLRITTASIFLLKAMSIGVRNGQLKTALGVLHRSVQALRSSVLDDMHLANSYAALLEIHIKRLQKSFLKSTIGALQSSSTTRLPSVESSGYDIRRSAATAAQPNEETSAEWFAQLEDWDNFSLNLDSISSADNDWLSLPFDPAMAPFSTFQTGMDDGGLGFIWNLPT